MCGAECRIRALLLIAIGLSWAGKLVRGGGNGAKLRACNEVKLTYVIRDQKRGRIMGIQECHVDAISTFILSFRKRTTFNGCCSLYSCSIARFFLPSCEEVDLLAPFLLA